jgi:AraC family transcriptional regulator of adaptative response/methylated-DNA-[protein]-cysteine methyltransferase
MPRHLGGGRRAVHHDRRFGRKRRDVPVGRRGYITGMDQPRPIDPIAAWTAFAARDRAQDGRFVVAVRTTGIYCKPSCPARHPRRENVRFYPDGAAARAAGFRACLRCRPDEVARDHRAVAQAIALIDAAEEPLTLDRLAAQVGYAPHHFHRLFKRATGVTPAAFARGRRASAATRALDDGASVTAAIYAAGYSAPSRFYDHAAPRLGMTPGAWQRGGAGIAIRWTIAGTSLGPLLIAATDKGLCRVAFEEDEAALQRQFPNAAIMPGDAALAALAAAVVAQVESPDRDHQLPLDVRGTAFREAIWQQLRRIPPGETRSYADLAAAAGNPGAVRAAGSACGANPLAVVIPCHRVQRGDGAMGGYAWGIERKRALREREGTLEREPVSRSSSPRSAS